MELTVKNLVFELKRQLIDGLPLEAPLGGGMHSVVARAFIDSPSEKALCAEALEVLLIQLAEEYPDWEVGIEGYPGDRYEIAVSFTR